MIVHDIINLLIFYELHKLHTYLNKATGALIFASPFFCIMVGFNATAAIICFAALSSSVEKMMAMAKLEV